MNFREIENMDSPFFLFPTSSPTNIDDTMYTSAEYLNDASSCENQIAENYSSANIWEGMEPLSAYFMYNNQNVHHDVGYHNSAEDYTITSLDDVTLSNYTTTSEYVGEMSESSDTAEVSSASSPSAESETSTCEESVTTKLKSVLLSRQRMHTSSSASSLSSAESATRLSASRYTDNHMHQYDTNSRSLRFPPCSVCGGNASGLHYGVNSCEPCKGFFTRYLRRKEDDYYTCSKDDNCVITNKLRGNCSACRLKKCLALGMSRKNSRLGRYSLSRRMETIMQVHKLENNAERVSEMQPDLVFQTAAPMPAEAHQTLLNNSSDDPIQEKGTPLNVTNVQSVGNCKLKAPSGFSQKLVKVLTDYMEHIKPYGEELVTEKQVTQKLMSHYESYTLKIQMFGNLKTIPKEEYFRLLNGFGIEIDKRMTVLKQGANEIMNVISRYCEFAKHVPHFKQLSIRDQSNLLKASRYDFFMILMHEGYLRDQQVFLAHNGVAFHQEEVADKFFSRQLVENVCDMYYRLQNLKLTREEKALLIAISLVFTDRCALENPNLVDQIQVSLTQLLQRQLEKTNPSSATRRFTKIIDCLTIMRESSELYLIEYNQLCQDEKVIGEVPIMTELLFEDK
ncbi:nuclear receptor subfamily 1 group D member 2-like isoform X2 [Dreissena polymorpha]|nr:nuclear receptor subfamily 1 group D member 2-like isoform X2 [Dreissena polymorpha]